MEKPMHSHSFQPQEAFSMTRQEDGDINKPNVKNVQFEKAQGHWQVEHSQNVDSVLILLDNVNRVQYLG